MSWCNLIINRSLSLRLRLLYIVLYLRFWLLYIVYFWFWLLYIVYFWLWLFCIVYFWLYIVFYFRPRLYRICI